MTTDPPRDAKFISAAQNGDRNAYGELVRMYWESTVNFVYRLTGDLSLAQEAAQEAFMRAWDRLASYRPEHSFRSWVFRIAANLAFDELRRKKIVEDIDETPVRSEQPGPEETMESQEMAHKVRQAVLALPEASRAVLILREYEGLTYQEIGDALHIPLGTVMSRLNYARGILRQRLLDEVKIS